MLIGRTRGLCRCSISGILASDARWGRDILIIMEDFEPIFILHSHYDLEFSKYISSVATYRRTTADR